jgi:hypothetical protein
MIRMAHGDSVWIMPSINDVPSAFQEQVIGEI